jgi:protease I
MENIKGKKVAILVENGFEQSEMVEPRKALDEAGAKTTIVSPAEKEVRGWKMKEWGDTFPVDLALDRAKPEDFDALLLPGGVMNPDGRTSELRLPIFPFCQSFLLFPEVMLFFRAMNFSQLLETSRGDTGSRPPFQGNRNGR